MKTILKVKQFDDLCVNKDGITKIFTEGGTIEIEKDVAYELGLFLYRILDLLAPEITEKAEEDEEDEEDEPDSTPKSSKK